MSPTTRVAMMAVPMAVYLYVLGIFHGGKHSRVVAGSTDLAWLMVGLSGLIAFGPVGQVVVTDLLKSTTITGWTVWVVALVGVAFAITRTGRDRLVIYHVEADQVPPAIATILDEQGASFGATLSGFEDVASRTSVKVRVSSRMKTAVVEVQGGEAGPVIAALRLGLSSSLRTITQPSSLLSTAFFLGSGMLMSLPTVGFFLIDPQGRQAIRTVKRWLGWG